MTSRRPPLLPLLAIPLALAGGAGLTACAPTPAPARVTIRVALDPSGPPPVVRAARVNCAGTHYFQPGRHHWLRGRYVFRKGRCVRRPSSWHSGCRFVPGRWIKRGHKYEYRSGSSLCRSTTVVAHPIALPPPMRPRVRCSARHYVQRGQWQWRRGKWQWQPGRCVLRPQHWTTRGCRYHPSSWRRVGKRILYTKGGLVCRRPASTVHARRCTAAMRKAGRCGSTLAPRHKCKTGHHFVRGKCRAWGTRRRPKARRCTAAMRKAGRCGRIPPALRPCKKGYVRHRGKCVRRGVRRCTRAMRKAGRCR